MLSLDEQVTWLLESDAVNPGVRYFALKDLLDLPGDAPEVVAAQRAVMESGPVPVMLAAQEPEGYWIKPGPGYSPKYTGTVWQVMFLGQLGADGRDPRVAAACNYILDHQRCPYGRFSYNASNAGPIHCLEGNLAAALLDLGYLGDPRLDAALDGLARSITGDGIAPAEEKNAPVRYYRSGNSGPCFLCAANNQLACAWGAVKAMLALSKVPAAERTPEINAAITVGVEFLLSRDPAVADYPMPRGDKPSQSWFQLGYPIGYVTDVLQNLEALTGLGCGADPRLHHALEWLLSKRGPDGRWWLKYSYNRKTWVNVEKKGEPSKWVTLRALRVLKRSGMLP